MKLSGKFHALAAVPIKTSITNWIRGRVGSRASLQVWESKYDFSVTHLPALLLY